MTARAHMRGHPVQWDDAAQAWRYDDGTLAPSHGGDERPCRACGVTAEGADSPDPCLGWLPGVTSACCGHGVEPAQITYHSLTCRTPCPGWGCQCRCHTCPDRPSHGGESQGVGVDENGCCATEGTTETADEGVR